MADPYIVLLISTLNALHGLLQFYAKDYSQINVDGLFGLRLMEGQLKHVYTDFDLGLHNHVPIQIMNDIKSLSVNASKVANTALPYVFDQDPEYFKRFKYLVHQPWTISHPHRLTEPRLEWSSKSRKHNKLTENETDECIYELLNSAASVAEDWAQDVLKQNPDQFGCKKVTKMCLNKMLNQKGLVGYELTHQVLYTNVAELVDCMPVIDDYLKEIGYKNGATNFHLEFCSNLLHDVENLAVQNGGLDRMSDFNQDLMMEIQFVCGQLGFVEFVRREWLEWLLAWQDKSGCYKQRRPLKESASDQVVTDQPAGRKLLREKILLNSCASHKSAVAAGALCTYLRFLVDPGSGETKYLRLDSQSSKYSLNEPDVRFYNGHPINLNDLTYRKGFVPKKNVNELEFELISPPPMNRSDKTIFAFILIIFAFGFASYQLCRSRSMRSWKYKVLKY